MPSVVNELLTSTVITLEALRILENNLTIALHTNREYSNKFAVEGAKIGDTVNARKPPRYLGRRGPQLQLEASVEGSVPIKLDTLSGVDLEFSDIDLLLSIDLFSQRFIKPAMATITNGIDTDVADLYTEIYNIVGTPGTTPSTLLTYLLAGVELDNTATPRDGERGMFLTPLMQAYIVDALKRLFQSSAKIAEQYTNGEMGTSSGFDWFMDQNMPTHTVGTYSGTPLVNGAGQSGTSLITDGWTADSCNLNEGDNLYIAGVYAVNPQSRRSTGALQKFVVRLDADDTAGAMTLSIQPPMIASGAFQTVSALPADNAAITVVGASGTVSPQGIALHRDCIAVVSADLPLPRGLDMAERIADDQLGFSCRITRDFDINNMQMPTRTEVLYGVKMVRAELGTRIAA